MADQEILREVVLPNGLLVTVRDGSRHYFGGYWQVALEVTCPVPVRDTLFADVAEAAAVRDMLGESVQFVRRLERMAVPDNQRAAVMQQLLERFESVQLPFLGAEHFAERFVRSEYRQRLKRTTRGIPCLL